MKQLLKSKLQRPRRRPRVVDRQRLIERLTKGHWQKLSLVTGPAGSGKSTLLTEWLHHIDTPSTWLTLDEKDDDPWRFALYLIAALRDVAPHVGAGVDALISSPGKMNFATLLESLVLMPLSEEPTELVLVLDDYHLIKQRDIHLGVDRLLQYMPVGMHLVISSRVTPPLELSSLRVRGELNEIRPADLRFTEPEASLFYNQTMALDLKEEQVEAIEQHTEGWAAASQMAALRLRDGQKPASLVKLLAKRGGLVSEYLLQEVLDKQQPELRDFLFTISVLDRLCDPLCEALMDSGSPPMTLDQLSRKIFFLVSLDDEGRWYRLHHLFRSLLRAQLTELSDKRISELHKRASNWFAKEELLLEAGEQAVASQDSVFLADLIDGNRKQLIATLGYSVLSKWLNTIPDAIVDERPKMAVLRAWSTIIEETTSSPEAEIDRLQKAANNYQKRAPTSDPYLVQFFKSEIDTMRATLCMVRGEYEEAFRTTERAREKQQQDDASCSVNSRSRLDLISGRALWHLGDSTRAIGFYERAEKESLVTGRFYGHFQAIWGHTSCLITLVNLNQAYLFAKEGLKKAKEAGYDLIGPVGNIHYALGILHLLRNEPELLLAEIDRAIGILRLTVEQHTLTWSYVFQVSLMLSYVYRSTAKTDLNDREGALADINEALALSKSFRNNKLGQWLKAYSVLVEIRNGVFTRYDQLVEELLNFKASPIYSDQDIAVLRAIIMIMQNEPQAALKAIEPSFDYALQYRQELIIIRSSVCKAAALDAIGKRDQAVALLEQTIEKAMPEKLIRPFYDLGPQLQPLVPDLKQEAARDFLKQAMSEPDTTASPSSPPIEPVVSENYPESEPIESLSQRQIEVLSLIARGFSNSEIASSLYVTQGTIKTHIHNILTKLNAKSRTHAVRIAQKSNLLSGIPKA